MRCRKYNSKTKARIVLEGLQERQPLSELCNKYQILEDQYYEWRKEFLAKSAKAFETAENPKREVCLTEENRRLKRIIAEQNSDLRRVASIIRTLHLNHSSPSGYEREFLMKEHLLLSNKYYHA